MHDVMNRIVRALQLILFHMNKHSFTNTVFNYTLKISVLRLGAFKMMHAIWMCFYLALLTCQVSGEECDCAADGMEQFALSSPETVFFLIGVGCGLIIAGIAVLLLWCISSLTGPRKSRSKQVTFKDFYSTQTNETSIASLESVGKSPTDSLKDVSVAALDGPGVPAEVPLIKVDAPAKSDTPKAGAVDTSKAVQSSSRTSSAKSARKTSLSPTTSSRIPVSNVAKERAPSSKSRRPTVNPANRK